MEEQDLVENKGFLSQAEVSAGAVAKEDQNLVPHVHKLVSTQYLCTKHYGVPIGCLAGCAQPRHPIGQLGRAWFLTHHPYLLSTISSMT